jgi:hypothetical protein
MKKAITKPAGLKIELKNNFEPTRVPDEQVELLFLEEFNEELDAKFL